MSLLVTITAVAHLLVMGWVVVYALHEARLRRQAERRAEALYAALGAYNAAMARRDLRIPADTDELAELRRRWPDNGVAAVS